ncbi:hypothetical protein ACRAWF_36915 [Streptomyces sp. L7]
MAAAGRPAHPRSSTPSSPCGSCRASSSTSSRTSRIDNALVFATGKGGFVAYLPPQRPTRGDIAANRYTAVYEVDMGVHPHTCELALPSDNDAFEFTAAGRPVPGRYCDPVRFVASGHRNVPGLLLGELQQAARPVTRRFAIADSASAEVELLERMNPPRPARRPRRTPGHLDAAAEARRGQHRARAAEAGPSSTPPTNRSGRRSEGMDIDVEVDRRARQGRRAPARPRHAVRHPPAGTPPPTAALAARAGPARGPTAAGTPARLEAQKIEFYQFHLQQGGVHQWALHSAQHPEDSHMVMNSMREDQLRMIQAQMELVQQRSSTATRPRTGSWRGPKQLALRTVNDILTQRLPGVPQEPTSAAPLRGRARNTPASRSPAPPRG